MIVYQGQVPRIRQLDNLNVDRRRGRGRGSPMFSIRKAVPADAEAMFAVHKASVLELCAQSYSSSHMESWFEGRTPEIYTPALAAEQIWVAELSGAIVGFVGAQPGEVTLLFVLPEATGQGIGGVLLAHGLSAAEAGFSEPVVVVATLNSVLFYAGHGFVADGEQWFERGAQALRYPVLKMVRQGRTQLPLETSDA